eukprot:3259653-Pleurochrysis_carterae.AAC.1
MDRAWLWAARRGRRARRELSAARAAVSGVSRLGRREEAADRSASQARGLQADYRQRRVLRPARPDCDARARTHTRM